MGKAGQGEDWQIRCEGPGCLDGWDGIEGRERPGRRTDLEYGLLLTSNGYTDGIAGSLRVNG